MQAMQAVALFSMDRRIAFNAFTRKFIVWRSTRKIVVSTRHCVPPIPYAVADRHRSRHSFGHEPTLNRVAFAMVLLHQWVSREKVLRQEDMDRGGSAVRFEGMGVPII